jgi:hypothetical protein
MIHGSAVLAPTGIKGFDANSVVNSTAALALFKAGYRYGARYIPRLQAKANDLTTREIDVMFGAGLAVSPVQHVESADSWVPTDDKGRQYGDGAVAACRVLNIPTGTTVWLDLEGISLGVPTEQIIRYCNYWHDKVLAAKFEPGIYIGWRAQLTPEQLYKRLKFARYWSAYNANTDQTPITRGTCMQQHVAKKGDKPSGVQFEIDTDLITTDKLGDRPTLYAPDEWSVVK